MEETLQSQLLLNNNNNNNNEIEHYDKQEENTLSNNDKFVSVMKNNGNKSIITPPPPTTTIRNEWDTTLQQVNKYSYIVSIDKLQHEAEFHSKEVFLNDIHTDLLTSKESLLTGQGFIQIKEYCIDGYECRCHQDYDRLNDEDISDKKCLYDFPLEF